MSTERDNDPFFRQLEIIPGGRWPLSWDLRRRVLSAVANDAVLEFVSEDADRQRDETLPYLRELLDLPENAREDVVLEALRKVRAAHLELPDSASWDEILPTENSRRSALTMSDLRRLRDQRLGTYRPLVNGDW